MSDETKVAEIEKCPKCGSDLAPISETATGRKLQRCSKNVWNKETRKSEGCTYVKWIAVEPQTLDEKCPKCGSPLVIQFTRFGKKMKKCSTGGWDKEAKKAAVEKPEEEKKEKTEDEIKEEKEKARAGAEAGAKIAERQAKQMKHQTQQQKGPKHQQRKALAK